jgi:Rod binding domain-containing protein
MSMVWATSGSVPKGPAQPCVTDSRVTKAAHQFESVLLNELLGSLEKNLARAPGSTTEQEGNDYMYMGTQALATALGERGVLGISKTITQKLTRCG